MRRECRQRVMQQMMRDAEAGDAHAGSKRICRLARAMAVFVVACQCVSGCGHSIEEPSDQRMLDFQAAGPEGPAVDVEELMEVRFTPAPYRVAAGEVLDVQIPRMLVSASPEAATLEGRVGYASRVGEDGAIVLPMVGKLSVAGKSLEEVESRVMSAYYPRYTKTQPAVYVSVAEYKTYRIPIVGAVARPGVYPLRANQMSLVTLLMEAGGIADRGAAVIRIRRGEPGGPRMFSAPGTFARPASQRQGSPAEIRTGTWTPSPQSPGESPMERTLILPVRGLNIPFEDVALQEGDSVVVEWPREQFICVMGLVTRPGCFPYPVTAQYNLVQAVALAGGLDLIADPRYVTLYRLNSDGQVSSVTVQLVNPKNQESLTEALSLPLKPGDVVFVEHTPRTRMNLFLDRVFRVTLGLYLSPDDLWDDNG